MAFSFSSWKKSSPDSGASAPAAGGGMRNRAMILLAVLGLGTLGYKMFWPDSVPLKAAAAMPKSPSAMKAGASAPKQSAKASARQPNETASAARTAPVAKPKPKPAPVETTPPDDTDIPSPAEMVRGPKGKPLPATQPTPAPMNDSLGPAFVDENNGFSMRFPTGWAIRTFASEPWVLDCGDGRTALISLGFSAFPPDFTAENIPPEWVARRIKKRNDTTLHSQGYALIGGKKALWSKSTGPLPMTNGNPRMTRVNYIIPLHDGRVMELRIATTPELFDQLMPTMRQSVESFKFIARTTAAH